MKKLKNESFDDPIIKGIIKIQKPLVSLSTKLLVLMSSIQTNVERCNEWARMNWAQIESAPSLLAIRFVFVEEDKPTQPVK